MLLPNARYFALAGIQTPPTHNNSSIQTIMQPHTAMWPSTYGFHYGPHKCLNCTLLSGTLFFPVLSDHWLFCLYLWKIPMKLNMIFFLRSPWYPTNKETANTFMFISNNGNFLYRHFSICCNQRIFF